MTELFQYRFRNSVNPSELSKPEPGAGFGEGLRDHSFGNLLIAAMCAIKGGDFEAAVRETSRVLNVKGRVLPSTVTHVRLRGEMSDGSFVEGESAIASSPLKIKRVHLLPEDACPAEDVIEAILGRGCDCAGPRFGFHEYHSEPAHSGHPRCDPAITGEKGLCLQRDDATGRDGSIYRLRPCEGD